MLCVPLGVTQLEHPEFTEAAVPEIVTWAKYKNLFGKRYLSAAAEDAAKKAFEANVAFIQDHNGKADRGLTSFRCGVNRLSDLSRAQFRALYLNSGYVSRKAREVSNFRHGQRLALLAVGPAGRHSVTWLVPCSLYSPAASAVSLWPSRILICFRVCSLIAGI